MVHIKLISTVGTIFVFPKARVVWVSGILNVLTKLCWLNRCGAFIPLQILFWLLSLRLVISNVMIFLRLEGVMIQALLGGVYGVLSLFCFKVLDGVLVMVGP